MKRGRHWIAALAALAMTRATARRALAFAIGIRGFPPPDAPDPNRRTAWGWTPDVRSTVEPTARVMLAVNRLTPSDGETRAEAMQLLHERRCADGGWNYGNASVNDVDLRSYAQTTAMALYDFRAYQEIADANLRRMARRCRAAGVPCALLTYPHRELPPNPYTRTELYHVVFGRTPLNEDDYLIHDRRPGEIAIDAVIRRVSEQEDVPLVDLQPAFDAAPAGTALLLEDLHHPTAAGHALIARTVADAIGAPRER